LRAPQLSDCRRSTLSSRESPKSPGRRHAYALHKSLRCPRYRHSCQRCLLAGEPRAMTSIIRNRKLHQCQQPSMSTRCWTLRSELERHRCKTRPCKALHTSCCHGWRLIHKMVFQVRAPEGYEIVAIASATLGLRSILTYRRRESQSHHCSTLHSRC
jgi:hypothetical protein